MISDHHRGLMNAIDKVMIGSAWRRCRVHFMRNILANVPKGQTRMVAAAIRTIFSQPNAELVRKHVDIVADNPGGPIPDCGKDVERFKGRDHDVRGLPEAALGEDVVYKSDRAVKS